MKSFAPLALALSALASQANAHYIFQQFSKGATKFPVLQYIRPNSNRNSPITNLTSNDLRCNQGGETGGSTETISMNAGDAFSFTADVQVYHNGPLSIYMAKAPTTAQAFDGSGQVWFKILDIGPTFDSSGNAAWTLLTTYTANIPAALPSGEYLLRIQQLGIHNPYPSGLPQFYLECAQVSITNGGSGTPGPLVSIPGFIDGTEPGYTVNIYTNFHNYTVPGPAVWNPSGGGSTATVVPPPVSTTATSVPASTPATTVKPTTTLVTSTTKTSSVVPTPTGAPAPKYGQCGGAGWTGATTCVSGSTCKATNQYYSQCV